MTKKKRGNGEGSITKRSDGLWMAQVTIGRDNTGKLIRKTVYGKTQKEALSKKQELERLKSQGVVLESSKVTLGEWLERWLTDYARLRVRITTFENYKSVIENHIVPKIGHIQIKKLQPAMIQGFYREMLESGRVDNKGGLSAKTVRIIHGVLHSSLNQALKENLILRNVTESTIPPRLTQSNIQPLTVAEVKKLLDVSKDDRLFVGLQIALGTGARRGEILGLRWQHVDIDNGLIRVNQSLVRTRKGLIFQEPKTKGSSREIPLPENVVKALKGHRARQNKEKLLLGEGYRDKNLVLCRQDGEPLDPRGFVRWFERMLEKAGLPHIRFHDLRHSHATLLLKENVHPKIVMERLGHSDIGTTLNIYSHVIPGLQKEAVAKIDSIFA